MLLCRGFQEILIFKGFLKLSGLGYILRKYPTARWIAYVIVAVIIFFISAFITRTSKEVPVISYITPAVGTPGDVLVIHGDFFGNSKDTSYVEMSGNRLTESSYLSWENNEIKLIVPANIQDGLIYVVTQHARSNPDFFANESAIPVSMPENPMQTIPVVSTLSSSRLATGQLLVINGKNFGSSRENSNVFFSIKREDQNSESSLPQHLVQDNPYDGYLPPSDLDYDYEYWSESEIRVRVPDGASDGYIYIETPKGRSKSQPFSIENKIGQKKYISHNTYLIQVGANISNIVAGSENTAITIHMPHPVITAAQPTAKMVETMPEPILWNYRNTSIFQTPYSQFPAEKESLNYTQDFVVAAYSVENKINPDNVRAFSERSRMLCKTYTKTDEIVPADVKEIRDALPEMISNVKNPYRQAELIYNYFTEKYKILNKTRQNTGNPLDMLKTKRGDAYDFAILYTAFLRTCGIPARPVSGILVDGNKVSKNHWWCEFYIENYGWIPVDPAIGAGLEFKSFQLIQNPKSFYFGNIDSQHIAFSVNWNSIKQAMFESKAVSMQRNYALQSIWEESSNDIRSYSSFWKTPVVMGIY